MQNPCFKALTRPVSFLGLPFKFVVILAIVCFGGFIATLSFVYLLLSALIGYGALRLLSAYDPMIIDVIFVALSKTPLPPSYFKGKGIIYRA
ncbi:type IV secretion system protein (plasmid) [Roseobacter denitrificans]|uniref:Type IV secretion system protein, putative n=1 Tax=Roseobacter denitrificans (strain ATCC 33942 / OCh 114) TaxID=375451 RepID=Q07GT0_ROSDO|nr:VirB3 family type IV secretion system protein [Roseobacter denitrificans]ABI93319.1 type IV secretion system protein, putative [Roseobacter denitrificans OCh 114]AVL51217.1 type IV secretion system protein [Roseobacter denitrificans]SFG40653.1 type IV secretion system protein VirB3 [Roseobacter denitrificans OCh 114]